MCITKCFIGLHDWVVLGEKHVNFSSFRTLLSFLNFTIGIDLKVRNRICLRCKKFDNSLSKHETKLQKIKELEDKKLESAIKLVNNSSLANDTLEKEAKKTIRKIYDKP